MVWQLKNQDFCTDYVLIADLHYVPIFELAAAFIRVWTEVRGCGGVVGVCSRSILYTLLSHCLPMTSTPILRQNPLTLPCQPSLINHKSLFECLQSQQSVNVAFGIRILFPAMMCHCLVLSSKIAACLKRFCVSFKKRDLVEPIIPSCNNYELRQFQNSTNQRLPY